MEAPHFWYPRNVYRFLTRVNSIYRRFDSIRHGTRGPVLKIVIASPLSYTVALTLFCADSALSSFPFRADYRL